VAQYKTTGHKSQPGSADVVNETNVNLKSQLGGELLDKFVEHQTLYRYRYQAAVQCAADVQRTLKLRPILNVWHIYYSKGSDQMESLYRSIPVTVPVLYLVPGIAVFVHDLHMVGFGTLLHKTSFPRQPTKAR
jgi:hypothetical protein